MKVRSRLILMFSIWEILLTWVITRTLDYFVRFLRRKINIKVDLSFLRSLSQIGDKLVTEFYISNYFDDTAYLRFVTISPYFFDIFVKTPLRTHRRLHKRGILEEKSCQSCQIIIKNKGFLQKLAPNPELYPPFKFSKR